jgi:hypothetical protein
VRITGLSPGLYFVRVTAPGGAADPDRLTAADP